MATLSSIRRQANVAVFGAGGAIGSAFVRHLADDPQVSSVYALSGTRIKTPDPVRGPARSHPY